MTPNILYRKDGGAEGDRTPDLCNAIAALSQLSYGPIDFGTNPAGCGSALQRISDNAAVTAEWWSRGGSNP